MTTPLDSSTYNAGGSLTTSQILSSPNPNSDLVTNPSQIQTFPPPQTFTFLPQLYTLISHLTPLQTPSHPNGTPTASTSRASRSPTLTRRLPLHLPDHQQPSTTTTDATTSSTLALTQTRSRDESIELKDLPALVYPLRQQIAQAKVVVKGLPDIGRTVAEQQREIEELEARIGALKGRIGVLGSLAGANGSGDVVMQGVEGDGT